MYEFRDINVSSETNDINGIKFTFNGVNLDEKFKGIYKTLTVSGRGVLSHENQMFNLEGVDGELLTSSSLPSRNIKIVFKIETSGNNEYRKIMNDLNELFYIKDNVKFSFSDEEVFYYGKLGSVDFIEETSNCIKSSINLICPDPFGYGKDLKTTIGEIETIYKYDIIPEEIVVTPNGGLNQIEIKNGDKIIQLGGDFPKSVPIVITIEKEPYIVSNKIQLLSRLSVTSDFENFTIKNGDIVICNGCDLLIKYREKYL